MLDRHQAVWTLSAIISILTTRHLLVELNVHFPLRLHCFQLATAGLIGTALYIRQRKTIALTLYSTTASQWLSCVVAAAATATSLLLSIQAILHFHNLPILPMLAAMPWSIEAFLYFFIKSDRQTRKEVASAFVALLACVGILVTEYRLRVPGLLDGATAMLLAGVARAVRHHIHEEMPGTVCAMRINLMTCGIGLVITGAALYKFDESWIDFIHDVQLHKPLVSANLLATATAILMGQSLFCPLGKLDSDAPKFDTHFDWSHLTASMLMVASIGNWSALALRRSYTNGYQMTFYLFSVFFMVGALKCNKVYKNSWVYERVRSTADLNAVSEEEDIHVQEYESIDTSKQRRVWRTVFQHDLFGLLLLFCLWVPFQTPNFMKGFNTPVKLHPALDHAYTPANEAEIVISMYKEPVEHVVDMITTLKGLPNLGKSQVHIYVKDSDANIQQIQDRTGADNITVLPNIGREGETYLHHIVSNWDTLARHTMFLQADVHNPREFYPRVRDYFYPPRTGMLSLGFAGYVCPCHSCGDRFAFHDEFNLFPRIHERIDNSSQCDNMLMSYKGQFVVSAKRIRGLDKSLYEDLHNAFTDDENWLHKDTQGRPNRLSVFAYGHALERVWNLLFQCNDMDVAWKCPSLLSGRRLGGSIEDCQCFDE